MDAEQPHACPFAEDLPTLIKRIDALEASMGLVTNNLAGFAAQHQRLHAQLHATLKEQGELVQRLVGAARGVAGTDWAEVLGDEIPKSKKLTRRWWPYIAAAVAAFGAFITWLVDLVRTH